MSLNLTMPLPPTELKANYRTGRGWRSLVKIKEAYKQECALALLTFNRKTEMFDKCEMVLTFYLGKGQRADPSDGGYWAKTMIDYLQEAMIIKSDSFACIRRFTVCMGERSSVPRIEVRIEQT